MTVKAYIQVEASNALKPAKLQAMREMLASKQAGGQLLSWEEVEQLNQQERLRQPVFDQLIFPVLSQGIEAHDLRAIKLLLRLMQYTYQAQDPSIRAQYEFGDLLQLGLQIAPDDAELLQLYHQTQKDYYEYTIHEVPWGILWDMNGVSAAQCDELMNSLDEFAKLSQQVGLDESALLAQCRYYYRSYADYLNRRVAYPDFAAYLAAHPA